MASNPKGTNIQVVVRSRPLSEAEKAHNTPVVVQCNPKRKELTVNHGHRTKGGPSKSFQYDAVYGQFATQEEVFRGSVAPIIKEVLAGYNCTAFAYGQTGTGKTFTMQGELGSHELKGVVPRAVEEIFASLDHKKSEYTIKVSCLQIYNEELEDLLAPDSADKKPLRIFEERSSKGGVQIPDLEEEIVNTADDIFKILVRSSERRISKATVLNPDSSRSHCIITLTIHSKETAIDGNQIIKTGVLNLVDLAGSECVGKSGATDDRAKEAGKINQSLLTLGRVINKLVEGDRHIPYRDSKLTRLLQESLGGKAKTVIIATVSPALSGMEETLNTLEYAFRAKNIVNKPQTNEIKTQKAYVKEMNSHISDLAAQLEATRAKNGVYLPPDQYEQMLHDIQTKTMMLEEYDQELKTRKEANVAMQAVLEDTRTLLKDEQAETARLTGELGTAEKRIVAADSKIAENEYVMEHLRATEAKLRAEAVETRDSLAEAVDTIAGLQESVTRRDELGEDNAEKVVKFHTDLESNADSIREEMVTFLSNQEASLEQIVSEAKMFLRLKSKDLATLEGNVDKSLSMLAAEESGLLERMAEKFKNISDQLTQMGSDNSEALVGVHGRIQELANMSAAWMQECNTLVEGRSASLQQWIGTVREETSMLSQGSTEFVGVLAQAFEAISSLSKDTVERQSAEITQCNKAMVKMQVAMHDETDAIASAMIDDFTSRIGALQARHREMLGNMVVDTGVRMDAVNTLGVNNSAVLQTQLSTLSSSTESFTASMAAANATTIQHLTELEESSRVYGETTTGLVGVAHTRLAEYGNATGTSLEACASVVNTRISEQLEQLGEVNNTTGETMSTLQTIAGELRGTTETALSIFKEQHSSHVASLVEKAGKISSDTSEFKNTSSSHITGISGRAKSFSSEEYSVRVYPSVLCLCISL